MERVIKSRSSLTRPEAGLHWLDRKCEHKPESFDDHDLEQCHAIRQIHTTSALVDQAGQRGHYNWLERHHREPISNRRLRESDELDLAWE